MAASEEIKPSLSKQAPDNDMEGIAPLNKQAPDDDMEGTAVSSSWNTRPSSRRKTISEDFSSSPQDRSKHLARAELRRAPAEPYSQKRLRYSSPSSSAEIWEVERQVPAANLSTPLSPVAQLIKSRTSNYHMWTRKSDA